MLNHDEKWKMIHTFEKGRYENRKIGGYVHMF